MILLDLNSFQKPVIGSDYWFLEGMVKVVHWDFSLINFLTVFCVFAPNVSVSTHTNTDTLLGVVLYFSVVTVSWGDRTVLVHGVPVVVWIHTSTGVPVVTVQTTTGTLQTQRPPLTVFTMSRRVAPTPQSLWWSVSSVNLLHTARGFWY